MSYYIHGSNQSYLDYLQTKLFVKDIASSTEKAGHTISMKIAGQTREVIASNEALASNNIMVMEATTDGIRNELYSGFEILSYELRDISAGISELNATFHWGFSQVIASMGHMNDALEELIKIAKTPVQTVAYNHFEIARDAFRQGLFRESLEEAQKAIEGDHTSPGYKLEWRFHQLTGSIHLGFFDCDSSLIDLPEAEESFMLAARYAKADFHEDASRAFLSAGWAAYCQGKMLEALAHTEQAIHLNPKLAEAFFIIAKVHMALNQIDDSLPVLAKAIDLDPFYALKAAGDDDFKNHEEKLHDFFKKLRWKKYQAIAVKAQNRLDNAESWLSRILPDDQAIPCVTALRNFLNYKSISLIDLLEVTKSLLTKIDGLDNLNQKWHTLNDKYKTTNEQAQNALKEISSLKQRFSEFDFEDAAHHIENILNEESKWPIQQMETELESRSTQISSSLEEAREKVITSLRTKLNNKSNILNNTKKYTNKNYDEKIKPYEEIRFHSSNFSFANLGCFLRILIFFGLFFFVVLPLFLAIGNVDVNSRAKLEDLYIFILSIITTIVLMVLIPPIISKWRKNHAGKKIKILRKKWRDEISKVQDKYYRDPEVIKLEKDLKSLQ